MRNDPKPSRSHIRLWLLAGFAVLGGLLLAVYQPDRPVADIVPGSSSQPTFVVQIIRPRMSLPVGGIVPPGLFGVESHLGFDSSSPGASIESDGPGRLKFSSDDWELSLVFDGMGQVLPGTQVIFPLEFQDQPRKLRARPADPAVCTLTTTVLTEDSAYSGSFDIELQFCEDASTGKSLGWPPVPLVLHGSFDRIPVE